VDTSGDGIANIFLYLIVLVLFSQVALRLLRANPGPRRLPLVALILTVAIGVPSLLQFALPAISDALGREPAMTLQHGQWWRVLTSVMAQDGGLVAAIFNLVVVAFVSTLAEWVWGRWRTVVLFVLPSIALNLLALAWNAPGGGSSFASDGLLMSLCGLGLVVSRSLIVRLCAVAAIAIGVTLVAINDAHGVAILVGAALGALFAIPRRRREPVRA
jgi:membrane associated rhomboid family serine protease